MAAVDETKTEVRAVAKYVRTAPRKAMLVAEQIRGLPVAQAQTVLAFSPRAAARDVAKVLASAVANAEANHDLAGDDLYVSAAEIGSGPTLKRWQARARGRAGRIRKRTCHITVRVAPLEGTERPRAVAAPAAPEKPKRARRAPAAAPATVDAPVQEAAIEAPEAATVEPEEQAAPAPEAPKRAPRKKAAAESTPAEPAAEKPARAPRKKAAAKPAEATEKPKRTTRKKATEPEPKEGADS